MTVVSAKSSLSRIRRPLQQCPQPLPTMAPFQPHTNLQCSLRQYGPGPEQQQRPRVFPQVHLLVPLSRRPRNGNGTLTMFALCSTNDSLRPARNLRPLCTPHRGTAGVPLPQMMYVLPASPATLDPSSTFPQTSKGPVSCDDKEGHYIIVPDDLINKRCEFFLLGYNVQLIAPPIRSYGATAGSGHLWQGCGGRRHSHQHAGSNQDNKGDPKVP